MTKLVGVSCLLALLLLPAKPLNEQFSKYKRVEAYEIRPGILMMPRYSANGQVCMVLLQKDHFVKGVDDLDSTLPRRETIIQLFDELAPPAERGPATVNSELARLSMYSGPTVTSLLERLVGYFASVFVPR